MIRWKIIWIAFITGDYLIAGDRRDD